MGPLWLSPPTWSSYVKTPTRQGQNGKWFDVMPVSKYFPSMKMSTKLKVGITRPIIELIGEIQMNTLRRERGKEAPRSANGCLSKRVTCAHRSFPNSASSSQRQETINFEPTLQNTDALCQLHCNQRLTHTPTSISCNTLWRSLTINARSLACVSVERNASRKDE